MNRLLLACLLALTATARADVVYFAEDLNTAEVGTDNNDTIRINHPLSDAARDAFFLAASPTITQNFDSFAANSPIDGWSLGGVTVGLTPSRLVWNYAPGNDAPNGGRPISGNQLVAERLGETPFTLTFSQPVSGVGFYVVDNETPNNIFVQTADGYYVIPSQADLNDVNNTGSVLYWGLVADKPFDSLTIGRINNGVDDGWLIDDFSLRAIPEPSTILLSGIGLAMLAWYCRRRR